MRSRSSFHSASKLHAHSARHCVEKLLLVQRFVIEGDRGLKSWYEVQICGEALKYKDFVWMISFPYVPETI